MSLDAYRVSVSGMSPAANGRISPLYEKGGRRKKVPKEVPMDVRHVEQWQRYRGKGSSERGVEKEKLLAWHLHEAERVIVSVMVKSSVSSGLVDGSRTKISKVASTIGIQKIVNKNRPCGVR